MYDNNNYPNSNTNPSADSQNPYDGQQNGTYYRNTYGNGAYVPNEVKNPYDNRTESYQYGNTYPNNYTQMNQSKAPDKEKIKEKKGRNGFLKKALVSVSLGLLFGIFAGVGIYAVQSVTNLFGDSATSTTIESAYPSVEYAPEEVEAIGDTVEEDSRPQAVSDSDIRVVESATRVVSTDVSEVVKEVMPAIVSIDNHYKETLSYWGQSFTNEADASGSGIIVGENDTELLIVTNYHVVADTEGLTVQFMEGSEVSASVKGTDADMDLAVIAVPLTDIDDKTRQAIAIATLGDSDALEVGEPAIAIGNSLGYGQSVTTGVISALDRDIELSGGSKGTFIQTDAAINPGNSGGALLNIKGEVIGINSVKIGASVVEGMGYAIPISSASPIIADLMLKETKNKVAEEERGYLGISGINVTADVSAMYGIPEGVFISQVYPDTAAYAAGLQKGDIITEFEGEEITTMQKLQKELEFYAIGDKVEITVMSASSNGYESRKVQLTLGNKVQN